MVSWAFVNGPSLVVRVSSAYYVGRDIHISRLAHETDCVHGDDAMHFRNRYFYTPMEQSSFRAVAGHKVRVLLYFTSKIKNHLFQTT